ncbi:MAG: hypothetical protein CR986_04545 [Ignavibacteriae bacterium]|nr:MAG: hypothetical protein CR986_04545 [Ignavibacteriota bacterium]
MYKFSIKSFIFLLILLCNVYSQDDYKLLHSSQNSLVIEYTPSYKINKKFVIDGSNYLDIQIDNGSNINNKEGLPYVPSRIFTVGVQEEFGNNIQIINTKYKILNGKLKPFPQLKKENGFPKEVYNESEEYSNFQDFELVTFGQYGLARDLQIQEVIVNPIQFNPKKNQIKLFEKIVFQINFSKSNVATKIRESELLKDIVVNDDVVETWKVKEKSLTKRNIKNSVLAQGDWFKFEAPEEGIYRINYEFLEKLGIPIDNINPKTIKIYNNGGYILPSGLLQERPIDLTEIAIIVNGEDDGSFNTNDEILFYGRGVDFWEFNSNRKKIIRNRNYYSKHNYYWLTYGGSEGKRMVTQQNVSGTADLIQTTTKAFKFQDVDNRNLMGSGLLFIEDDYTSTSKSKTYMHTLDGLQAGSKINYKIQFVNGSKTYNKLSISEHDKQIFSNNIRGNDSRYSYGALTKITASYSDNLPDNRSILKFSYTPRTISDLGHLDFIEIQYIQNLMTKTDKLPVIIFSELNNGITEFKGTPYNNSNFSIYNITDYADPKIVNAEINSGDFVFKSNENDSVVSKYLCLQNDLIKVPTNAVKEENTNIRGEISGAKYVIITHKNFSEQAERLLNYRMNEAPNKISGIITYIDEIFNEFSCGSLDPTAIRDYLKYAYDNWATQPEYVLLFGDGDFDYFNTLNLNKNFIPTFQTMNSLYEIYSYPYDDYYSRISGKNNDHVADLGMGRLNVNNTAQAKIIVDKIIEYETKLNKGLWRNKITLLGDDGYAGPGDYDGSRHTNQSELLNRSFIPKNFDIEKIYLSNYESVNTGLGRRKPACNQAIISSINNGTLLFNYFGHGSPDVWAHERVFTRSVSIPQLKNKEYFFLTAATCDFGKFDDPNTLSATEEMLLLENAGMIGGLSAARVVESNSNFGLSTTFYKNLLQKKDDSGFPVTIGKAFYLLKQQRRGVNDEKFHLFGDPYLRLNIPVLPIKITSVNNEKPDSVVNIKSLSKTTIKGKVLNLNNQASNQTGECIVTVYDSYRTIPLEDIKYKMTDQGGIIFRGRVSVENGQFSTSFIVPKDISYDDKNGKIIAYFFNDETDGVGYTENIFIGGTDTTNANDKKGPEIEILYDNETESSYLVGPNFNLRVKLFDESGLNTTGLGIGHKLEAILNDDEENSIDLTNYFIGNINSDGKAGEVNYKFSSLESGEYKIKINAWDVYNNFSTQENYFTVVTDEDLVVRQVYNYPNPFSSNTFFTFQHNLNEPINVKIKIYTVAGRVIKEIENFGINTKFVKIGWNGRDKDNNEIANGTYLYKLIVKSETGKYKKNILGKMAVIK